MPTSTQAGTGASYIPRNQFVSNSVVKVNLDTLEQVPAKGIGRAAGGSSTVCKVLAAIAALCVVGAAVGAGVGLTVGKTTTATTTASNTAEDGTVTTATTVTTVTATTSTATTATTSTSVTTTTTVTTTTITTQTTTSTTTQTTTTGLQALSLLAQVTASGFYGPAGTATVQGDSLVGRTTGGGFSAGGYAPQYVQLELPGTYTICNALMLTNQAPSGATNHQISTGTFLNSTSVVTSFVGSTSSGQWLNATYNPCLTSVRFIRLSSISSPSWIAWSRFYVYGI